MARTFRRMSGDQIKLFHWSIKVDNPIVIKFEQSSRRYFIKYMIGKTKVYKTDHSCKRLFRDGVPSWFTNLYCQRSFRMLTRTELIKFTKDSDHEVMCPEFKRLSGYWWY